MTDTANTYDYLNNTQLSNEISRYQHLVNLFPDDRQPREKVKKMMAELQERLKNQAYERAYESLNS
jgi:hypothetical protein